MTELLPESAFTLLILRTASSHLGYRELRCEFFCFTWHYFHCCTVFCAHLLVKCEEEEEEEEEEEQEEGVLVRFVAQPY